MGLIYLSAQTLLKKKENYRTFSGGVDNINLASASGDSVGID
ncbi:MAG: hypothetical protein OXC61_09075 [Flavobacteriaceae bacterium]|nr:hypothetical protein [Flavobacteriaceae bacterium]